MPVERRCTNEEIFSPIMDDYETKKEEKSGMNYISTIIV